MKILSIRLINFISVHSAMGTKDVQFHFDNNDKPIIQIYGKNGCGKTVLIQQLHPFANVNLNGDERSDLALIIAKETGKKEIVYDVDGEIYHITHTYSPTRTGHSISSSLIHNEEELNPSGGVTVFNNLIERIFGINKYTFQFIINGTQLTSFGNMSTTQRKNLLNKAMGIDIYDKIHRLATDDYRYTNKLITSLNNTKEFILQTYGSFENLCTQLAYKQKECESLNLSISAMKSRLDSLSGQIMVIRNQNPHQELHDINNQFTAYKNVVNELGSFDGNVYDKLIDEQISLNNSITNLKNERMNILKDIDSLYAKKEDIENTFMTNKRIADDYNNMIQMQSELKNKIEKIHVEEYVSSSSSYLRSMLSLAQAINSTCKDIVVSLNDTLLNMLADMIDNNVDISAFLVKEGSVLMDSEKEKSTISRVRSVINSVSGEFYEDCANKDCIYWKTYDTLKSFFKSYQTTTSSGLSQYDIEQFEHAYKCVQTIQRLIRIELSDELKDMFSISNIIRNTANRQYGIDVDRITFLMEEAAKIETRTQYIAQLSDIEKTIENTKNLLITTTDDISSTVSELQNKIDVLKNKRVEIDNEIERLSELLMINDKHKSMVSQIQHVNVNELNKRSSKLNELIKTLTDSENEFNQLSSEYNESINRLNIWNNDLKILTDAHAQYTNTVKEIEKYQLNDSKYKIIAEATSSTKGKPVIAIRDKVEDAMLMTNRLLNVMYDGEIELLQPKIDESTFLLPFRRGSRTSYDIRYGSQSESTLLSLALSLSLASSLTPYNVPLIDETDAYLDDVMCEGFLLMLQEIMSTLNMEQMFIISHNIHPNQYEHLVHVIDISNERGS